MTWVNTIGMRPPRLDLLTARRGAEKLAGWVRRERREVEFQVSGSKFQVPDSEVQVGSGAEQDLVNGSSQLASRNASDRSPSAAPTVIDAKMWPWMSRRWDRWLNQNLLAKQLGDAADGAVAITTIPIVADLIGRLPVKSWIYYCVDDFSVWPGLDGKTLGRLEDELIAKVDRTIAVSDHLIESLVNRNCRAELLTHGVDVEFWRSKTGLAARESPSESQLGTWNLKLSTINTPLILFWGVVDRRMNADWVLALADSLDAGKILLAGPQQDPDPRLLNHDRIELPGSLPFEELPKLARVADVLIMPYADLPVTRAMQPLKLKEYLATGKPVVVSPLPATEGWKAFLQVARDAGEFVEKVHASLTDGAGDDTEEERGRELRKRLEAESWRAKSQRLLEWIEKPVGVGS
ncbi:Putative teichuronic acid biosynthesis glycosyltransferase TuaH [Stieleria magnilauensis]|uniref:Teichuronic acid biosynthesis glycosyltransferase TuaH n=1 Tax=Stieleria magnilauensis TaxID=2527963 RepID=A0ABX5XM18_9BACT|nr:Putative teichuronic acid biosynthesis glycosyltransferase TuaH [Planctomycetes bacterium TBK1r]